MRVYAVIDTNVLVAAMLTRHRKSMMAILVFIWPKAIILRITIEHIRNTLLFISQSPVSPCRGQLFSFSVPQKDHMYKRNVALISTSTVEGKVELLRCLTCERVSSFQLRDEYNASCFKMSATRCAP